MLELDDDMVKRIFNEVGLVVKKREHPLTEQELDKQIEEIMGCFEEVENAEDKG